MPIDIDLDPTDDEIQTSMRIHAALRALPADTEPNDLLVVANMIWGASLSTVGEYVARHLPRSPLEILADMGINIEMIASTSSDPNVIPIGGRR